MTGSSSRLASAALQTGTTCRYTLHIVDMDPTSASANGWLEDVTKVPKYEMSDDAYNKRDDTYRKYRLAKLKAAFSTLPTCLWRTLC